MTITLKRLRMFKGYSQRQLGELAHVSASYICNAESRGMTLYPNQAARLAKALGWEGDPSALFEEVQDDEMDKHN